MSAGCPVPLRPLPFWPVASLRLPPSPRHGPKPRPRFPIARVYQRDDTGELHYFAGGYTGGTPTYSTTVDVFNAGTSQWSTASLSQARDPIAATAAGNYALFAGGCGDVSSSPRVDLFNSSTGQWSTATLSQGRFNMGAASVGGYALFGGGWIGNGSNVVDIFSTATASWSTAALSQARGSLAATSVGKYALFAGGYYYTLYSNGYIYCDNVDIFNSDTGQWSTAHLSQRAATWRPRRSATTPSSAEGATKSGATATPPTWWTSSTASQANGPRRSPVAQPAGRNVGRPLRPFRRGQRCGRLQQQR